MLEIFSQKALPEGFVLEWGKYPYRIEKCVLADGFGFTYLATVLDDDITNSKVVIREFFMSRCCYRGDDMAEMMCDEEIEATVNDTLTRHARNLLTRQKVTMQIDTLINIIDVFEANGTYYHVAEYLDGPTLEDVIIAKGPLEPAAIRKLMLPIFDAVRKLHANNILHTDICPANIRFRNGKPVLTHLYAAKHFDENGEMAISLPSLSIRDGYAPPEQYGTLENFLPQVDIYALAATIIFCLTGKNLPDSRALTEQSLVSLLPQNLSKQMLNALLHATIVDLNDRTQTISTFREELDMNYQLQSVTDRQEDNGNMKIISWIKKNVSRLKSRIAQFNRDDIEDDDTDIDVDAIQMSVDEIEASMNHSYPRLMALGASAAIVIILLLISIYWVL